MIIFNFTYCHYLNKHVKIRVISKNKLQIDFCYDILNTHDY